MDWSDFTPSDQEAFSQNHYDLEHCQTSWLHMHTELNTECGLTWLRLCAIEWRGESVEYSDLDECSMYSLDTEFDKFMMNW